MAVHDCGDDRYVAFNRVDDGVRKTASAAFAMVLGDFCPRLRMAQDARDGAINFVQEFNSQAGNCVVVVFGSFGEFALGG